MSYPPWLPALLRPCVRNECRERRCRVRAEGPKGSFFIVRIDDCLSKRVPKLANKPVCDCAVVCEDLVCLVEIKCGTVRPGTLENEAFEQLNKTEDFLKRHGLADRRFKRIVAVRRYHSIVGHMLLRGRLQKRIRAEVLTPGRDTLTLAAEGDSVRLIFEVR